MVTTTTPDTAPAAELITLSTGVVLRLRQPSTWAVTEVVRQMMKDRPEPPVLPNPDRGRDEVNEADPDYQAALVAWDDRLLERKYEVVIATGTRVESLPADMPACESAEWLEVLAAVGLPQPAEMTATERYIRWVKYVAAPALTDWIALIQGMQPRAGTPETEVAAAAETFRSPA